MLLARRFRALRHLAVFNQLLTARYQAVAAVLLTVLLLHWRFCVLYSALTPIAKLEGALVLYFPLLLLPCWGRAVGEEVTEAELRDHAEVVKQITDTLRTLFRELDLEDTRKV